MAAQHRDTSDLPPAERAGGRGQTLHGGETTAKRSLSTVAAVDVVLVRWPAEAARREQLQEDGQPRVLLLEDGTAPPPAGDEKEDWIRLPAGEADLQARVEGLRRRLEVRTDVVPDLDEDGVLRVGDRWVALPPVEARLTRALLARYGAVVSRDALGRAGWPSGTPGRNALDVHMLRLRRRLSPLALAIRTVRCARLPAGASDLRLTGAPATRAEDGWLRHAAGRHLRRQERSDARSRRRLRSPRRAARGCRWRPAPPSRGGPCPTDAVRRAG